jgi:hypothetical protein
MMVSMPHPGLACYGPAAAGSQGSPSNTRRSAASTPDLLLAGGRHVAAEAAEALRASQGAPAPADLLLQLGHADVPLGLVVVERHPEVGGKAQHLLAVVVQAGQQVGGLGAAPVAAAIAGCTGSRVGPPALVDDRLVAGAVVVQAPGVQPVGAGGHGPPDCPLGLHQQRGHAASPGPLARQRGHPGQLAQVVGIAARMGGLLIAAIGRPAVVDRHALEAGQHAGGVHRLPAPLGMHGEQAEPVGAGRVQPVQPTRHPSPGLVEVGHRRRRQL